jgi:hypothetical protein
LTQEQRKAALKKLGQYLSTPDEQLSQLINSAHHHNAWFTSEETARAINGIAKMLNPDDIDTWLVQTDILPEKRKKVGLVLAGNIPVVGFHDIIAVLVCGHIALIKPSSQDKHLIPHLLNKLNEFEPEFADQVQFTERLEGFDAVIATGSNNTSRYFEYYFGKVPHIIRKNRSSVAVLRGNETKEDFYGLGHDIFDYFGLGCRNVSKLFVPADYNFTTFFESIETFSAIGNHHKYANNYDYNKSIYLINKDQHYDNGFLLLKRDERLASPLAVLFFEEYQNLSDVEQRIASVAEHIQCVVTTETLNITPQQVGFGASQSPKLWDYADGINTIDFLLSL